MKRKMGWETVPTHCLNLPRSFKLPGRFNLRTLRKLSGMYDGYRRKPSEGLNFIHNIRSMEYGKFVSNKYQCYDLHPTVQ
jgi:hypothetical protein